MEQRTSTEGEKPAGFWRKIYAAVVVTTIVVIAGLWTFSRYFS